MDNIVTEFEKHVRDVVSEMFPKLVVAEMNKLVNGKPERTFTAWDKPRMDQLRKLRAAGKTQQQIADALGTSQSMVSHMLKKLGDISVVGVKPKTKPKTNGKLSMHDALIKYGSKNAAAKALGIHHSTFQKRIEMEMNP